MANVLKEALRNLEAATKRLADINSALDEALIVAMTDQTGAITFANDKFCTISKYSRDELLGQNHRIINSGHHPKEFFREMWRTIARGQIWRGEIRNRAKDGSFYWMDTTIVPCLNETGKPYQYVSFRIDITERKKTEEFLRRTDKIEAVGQMASSVAHEIRNPLAAVQWAMENMRQTSEVNPEQLNLVLAELQRIDAIVEEFLVLARHREGIFAERDLQPIVESVAKLMAIQAHKAGISIRVELEDDLPAVRCDDHQIKQVLINILKNAIEASSKETVVHLTVSRQVGAVCIAVADQGVGMTEEQLQRLGEPFYTTKDTGTGLGLMVCFQILKEHHGQLRYRANPDGGTTAEIILPV